MKTVINTLIISAMILSISFAAEKPVFKKENNWDVIKKGENTLTLKEGYWTHRLGVNTDARNNRAVYDTISLYSMPTAAESYDDFIAGYQSTGTDSVIMRYHLLTDGIINEIHAMIHTGGPTEAWLQGPAIQWVDDDNDGVYETGWYAFPNDTEVGDPPIPATIAAITPFSVPVTFSASVPANHFTQDGDWEPWLASTGTGWQVVDFVSVFGSGIEVTATAMNSPNDEIYIWAGYTATSGNSASSASIYQDGSFHATDEEGYCPSFSTLHSIADPSGWYRIISSADDQLYKNHMMQIVVQYDAVPPIIENQAQFSDTFSETRRIWADVVDLDGDAFACTLLTSIADADGSTSGKVAMMADANTSGRYFADVSLDEGDTLSFQVYAEDATGRGNSGNIGSYTRVESPSQIKNVLLLQDGTVDSLDLYPTTLSAIGFSSNTYVWNTNDHDGVDSSVISYPNWKTIIKHGFSGYNINAAGSDELGYAEFMDNGGRFMLIDQDYLWQDGLPESGIFSSGDFAYDYLGVRQYENDPDPDSDGDDTNGGSIVPLFRGITGNPISNDWVQTDYTVDFESLGGWNNWVDRVWGIGAVNIGISYPTGAEKIFVESPGNTYAPVNALYYNAMGNSAPFKSIYFAFPIEGNPSDDFNTLFTNCVSWLYGTGGPSAAPTPVTPSSGSTITITDANVGTESQSFFLSAGNITDPDGDMIALRLEFSSGLEGFSVPAMEKATVNSFAVSYYDMAVFVGVGNTVTGTWTAVATDGTAEQVSASMDLTIDASGLTVLAVDAPIKAEGYSLHQNYPNPFNPQTKIQFEIANRSVVSIRIVDVLGQEVRNLGASEMNAGLHSAVWDGSNTLGEKMPTGVYFYEVTAIDPVSGAELFHDVSKMLLLK